MGNYIRKDIGEKAKLKIVQSFEKSIILTGRNIAPMNKQG